MDAIKKVVAVVLLISLLSTLSTAFAAGNLVYHVVGLESGKQNELKKGEKIRLKLFIGASDANHGIQYIDVKPADRALLSKTIQELTVTAVCEVCSSSNLQKQSLQYFPADQISSEVEFEMVPDKFFNSTSKGAILLDVSFNGQELKQFAFSIAVK